MSHVAGLLVLAMVGLSGAESWDKTVAMAKKEGKLVMVLGGGASRRYRPVLKFFENKFGIRTVASTGSGRKQADRPLLSAAPANSRSTSLWWGPLAGAEEFYRKIRGK